MAELERAHPPSPDESAAISPGDGWRRPLPGFSTETASPSIAELIEVIGKDATVRLCDTFGGMSREIGKPAEAIVAAIGRTAAAALREYWGRGRIYVPRRLMSTSARHTLVRQFAAEGLTRQAIAGRLLMSERQVYNVLAKRPARKP